MKKALESIAAAGHCWHFANGKRAEGAHAGLRGTLSRDLRGDVSGLRGDVDACEMTDADRETGVDVRTLVAESALKKGGA